jgi:hypothetical protein
MNVIIGFEFQIPSVDILMPHRDIFGHGKKGNKMIVRLEEIIWLMPYAV